jgi:hypothetical protein
MEPKVEPKDSLAGNKISRRFYTQGSQADLSRFWDYGEHFANQNRWCFECAWEVANKVCVHPIPKKKSLAAVVYRCCIAS